MHSTIRYNCIQPAKKGWTALHFAAFLLDLRAIDILLKHGCDSTVVTQVNNYTPNDFSGISHFV